MTPNLLGIVTQKEIILQNGRTLFQHLLRLTEIKLDV